MVVCLTASNLLGQQIKAANRPEPQVAVKDLGLGEKARVTVKLKDKSELQGYVSRLGVDDFAVTERKSGEEENVRYTDITAIKGNRISGGSIKWDFGARAREVVAKAGTGKGSRVDVKSRSGDRVKGSVIRIGEDSFVVAQAKTESALPSASEY